MIKDELSELREIVKNMSKEKIKNTLLVNSLEMENVDKDSLKQGVTTSPGETCDT